MCYIRFLPEKVQLYNNIDCNNIDIDKVTIHNYLFVINKII